MTTAIIERIELAPLGTHPDVLQEVSSNAAAVDSGTVDARYILPLLGPEKLGEGLLATARTIREISRLDLSAGFTAWAHRMTLEYLRRAATNAHIDSIIGQLERGERPGVTGMAAAFKEFAGCGEIELHAVPVAGGYRISGKLNWASNLYDDAVLVTAARTVHGDRIVFYIESQSEGVEFGSPFGLLGLNATASAWVTLDNVFVPESQIISHDFEAFIAEVRPTFVLLQVAECVGVAEAAVAAASARLTGVNETFGADVARVAEEIQGVVARQEDIIGRLPQATAVELLELRLDAASCATSAANIEVRVAGGAGYAQRSPASRRFREAAFIPVQSPSESQLRWELARARDGL
ncbi:acyl-CoA dehydrogenase family protein [Corynebacterium sp.]|uniref:acyl-CoA dehydrogenase family protein n=1 Tax=Corynebacterium sp. TaxID=1720 RepID=UPI0026DB88A6|nr:acyl-CoA dehydrogenase family protein [Corynebacterium sp.]MDO5075980.1 acyl-CoA dehydrogenase family protein [Corynebacterium sp.]